MSTAVNSLQNTNQIDDDNKMYEGSIPQSSYIASNEINDTEGIPSNDEASVSGASSSSNSNNQSSVNSTGEGVDEGSNYIPNDEELVDIGRGLDEDADDVLDMAMDEDNFHSAAKGEEGKAADDQFWVANEANLEKLYRTILTITNFRILLAMIMEQKTEVQDYLRQSFLDTDIYSNQQKKTSLLESTAKSNERFIKALQTTVSQLAKKIQDHNDEVYMRAMKRAESHKGSDWDNFWNSNGSTKRALKEMKQANQRYKNAMEQTIKTLDGMVSGAFKGINSSLEKRGNEILETLTDADKYIVYGKNHYIDLNLSKQWIVDLRRDLVSLVNANRTIVQQEVKKDAVKKAIDESFRGRGGLSNRMAGLESQVEAEGAHAVMLFDQLAGSTLQAQNLTNKVRYYQKQIDKIDKNRALIVFANIFKALSVVAAAATAVFVSIATFGSGTAAWVGVAVLVSIICSITIGVTSASLNLALAESMNAVSDAYKPTVNTRHLRERHNKHLNNILEKSEELQEQEEQYLAEIGFAQIDTLGDGHLAVNQSKIADIAAKINAIHNLQKIIAKSIQNRANKLRLMWRVISGISDTGGATSLMSSAIDEITRQGDVEFKAAASNLNEYTDSYNIELDQERAVQKARDNFIISIVIAVVASVFGGMLGGLTWALALFSAGLAIGNATGGLIGATRYSTRNTGYSVDASKYDPNIKSGNSQFSFIDAEYYRILGELLKNGVGKIGDGKKGLNTSKISSLLERLQAIFTVVSNITAMIENKSKVRKAITQAFTDVDVDSNSVSDLNRSNFENAMTVFRLETKMLNEHISVNNRARDAQKEFNQAVTNFVITMVLSAASIGCGAAYGIGVFNLGVAITNISVAISDLIYAVLSTKKDYGSAKSQIDTDKKTDKALARTQKDKIETEEEQMIALAERMEDLEANIKLTLSLVEDIGGGNIGLNSGQIAFANQRLEAINRIRELIADAMGLKKEVFAAITRIMGGIVPMSSSAMENVNYMKAVIGSEKLQNKMTALEQYIERHNEINSAKRSAWLAGVNLFFSAIQVGLASYGVAKTQGAVNAYDDAVDSEEGPTLKEQMDFMRAQEFLTNLSYCTIALNMLQSITGMIVGPCYDAAQADSHIEDHSKATSQKSNNAADQKAQEAKTSREKFMAMANKLDEWDAESLNSSYKSGEYMLGIQNLQIHNRQTNELCQSSENFIKSLINSYTSICQNLYKARKDEILMKVLEERQAVDDKERDAIQKSAAMAQAHKVFNMAADNVINPPEQNENSSANNSAILARLDNLEAEIKNVQTASDESMGSLDALNKSAEEAETKLIEIEPSLKDKTETPDGLQETGDKETPVTMDKMQDNHKNINSSVESSDTVVNTTFEGNEVEATVNLSEGTVTIDGKTMTFREYVERQQAHNSNYQFANDTVYEAIVSQAGEMKEKLNTSIEVYNNDFVQSEAFKNAADVEFMAASLSQAQKEMDKRLDAKAPKPIADMTPKELQSYYEKIYTEVFKPAQMQLQATLKEKREILSNMRNCDLSTQEGRDKYAKLEIKLNKVEQDEAQARATIRGFNMYVGKLNKLHREKTKAEDGVERDLRPVNGTIAPGNDQIIEQSEEEADVEDNEIDESDESDESEGSDGTETSQSGPNAQEIMLAVFDCLKSTGETMNKCAGTIKELGSREESIKQMQSQQKEEAIA